MNDDINDLVYKFLNGEISLDILHSSNNDVKQLSDMILPGVLNKISDTTANKISNENLYEYYNSCINDSDEWSILFVDKDYGFYNAYKGIAADDYCKDCPCYTAYEILSITDKPNNIFEEDVVELFK